MAQLNSFDITSPVDFQEVDNALNQARKEIGQRYDFKGARPTSTSNAARIPSRCSTDDDFKMNAIWEIVQTRLVRRSVPVKNFKAGDIEPAGGGSVRRVVPLQQGLPSDASRDIVKFLKDQKLKKVTGAIQADQVRVSLAVQGRASGRDASAARARLRRGAAVRELPVGRVPLTPLSERSDRAQISRGVDRAPGG